MKNSSLLSIIISVIILSSCGGKYGKFPMDKRYWTPDDYDMIVVELRYPENPEEKLPTFDDPETRMIVEKLTDEENYRVVLEDNELGLQYRNEVAERFFSEWKNMNQIYWRMDRQDKYIYPLELVECYKFGLGLQLLYFQIGNDAMIENAIDPNSASLKSTVNGNVGTLISNFNNYLSIIKNNEAFNEKSLKAYGDGIETYFTQLINTYPKANFNQTRKNLVLLKNKLEADHLIKTIDNIISMIDELKDGEIPS